jgi:serine/threonine-protein kinase
MGVVYRATDLGLERPVALKLISRDLGRNAGFRRRFEAESRIAASLDHPNVIPIFHAGEHDGVLYIAMRWVEGRDLSEELAERDRLAPKRAVSIIRQVASALDAAHAKGLVHRDVKPANVLLASDDHVYLTDFGLSKRLLRDSDETVTGELLGTLDYVAPEQIRGTEVGARTDVYALGCVLFHALTGHPPFAALEREGKLWAHVSETPPSLGDGFPPALDAVIGRAMAKEPSERFASAGDLAEAAANALSGEPEGIIKRSRRTRPGTYRRALLVHALLAPFSLALLVGILIAGWILGELTIAVPVALLIYAAGVAVTCLDEDVQRRVKSSGA